MITGISMGLLFIFLNRGISGLVLISSLGASAYIICDYPDIRAAKLRVVIMAYFFATLMGFAAALFFNQTMAIILAVALTSIFMLETKNSHPPAVGAAFAFILEKHTFIGVLETMASVLALLIIAKFLIYLYREEFHLHKFHREFSK